MISGNQRARSILAAAVAVSATIVGIAAPAYAGTRSEVKNASLNTLRRGHVRCF